MKRDLNDAEIIENNKIDNIQNVINWISVELWKDEEDLKNARSKIKEWILEYYSKN
jgi:hypothetical protein